jgi:hypothetical protein
MGSLIDKRLSVLEESFGDKLRVLDPDEGELARKLFREAFRRLSVVEMDVLNELADVYHAYPDLSPADVWRKFSEAQRDMEWRFRRVVRQAAGDLVAAGELPRDKETELVLAVASYPFRSRKGKG